MHKAIPILLALAALGVSGCDDTTTSPHDVTPPAAPRGLAHVTGDTQVRLSWLANTESDVSGYRIYEAPCSSGPDCPYDRIGVTSATQFVVTGLSNGVTRYFAVSAVDHAGNESPLSLEDAFDTPRPEGHGSIGNFVNGTAGSGWDFSAATARDSNDPATDMYFGFNGGVFQMFATNATPNTSEPNTEIQDMGYATTLDAVDFAPNAGWSPSGTVELIPGHNYVVWTKDGHFAKFRVIGVNSTIVGFDWAYQTAQGNDELRAHPVREGSGVPRPQPWLRSGAGPTAAAGVAPTRSSP